MHNALIVGFWSCLALVVYAYVAYPVLIYGARAPSAGASPVPPSGTAGPPSASLVLAAYNEEAVIEDGSATPWRWTTRRKSSRSSSAPTGAPTAPPRSSGGSPIGGSGSSTSAENRGKASVLNDAVARVAGRDRPDVRRQHRDRPGGGARVSSAGSRDPEVGAVVGRLVLVDPATGRNADGLYWKYETFLKQCEGRLGALLGANGAIYAIRRDLYAPIPAGTIVDDFVIPLLAKQRTGCRIVYDCEAVAVEETAPSVGSEFHRRARIGAGGFQSIGMLWRLLDPRRGWVAFAFLSHKVLRWLCPFFLIGAFAANVALAGRPFYRWPSWRSRSRSMRLAVLMAFVPAGAGCLRPLRLTTMFVGMNAALLVGFWRWLLGRQRGAWRRTARLGRGGGDRPMNPITAALIASTVFVRSGVAVARQVRRRRPRPLGRPVLRPGAGRGGRGTATGQSTCSSASPTTSSRSGATLRPRSPGRGSRPGSESTPASSAGSATATAGPPGTPSSTRSRSTSPSTSTPWPASAAQGSARSRSTSTTTTTPPRTCGRRSWTSRGRSPSGTACSPATRPRASWSTASSTATGPWTTRGRTADWCGVNNELDVLRETGCYADFTMPSAPSPTQTRTINSIYYAVDDPDAAQVARPRGRGRRQRPSPAGSLMLIQGPLVLDLERKWGCPRVENGCLQGNQPRAHRPARRLAAARGPGPERGPTGSSSSSTPTGPPRRTRRSCSASRWSSSTAGLAPLGGRRPLSTTIT